MLKLYVLSTVASEDPFGAALVAQVATTSAHASLDDPSQW